MQNIVKYILIILSVLLTVAGIVVAYVFFRALAQDYIYGVDVKILLPESGQVGDFMGGVVGTLFSLAGFLVLILTLTSQTRLAYIERFENKFFELIKLHRENINELSIQRKIRKGNDLFEDNSDQRKVFKIILDDFLKCREEILPFFKKKKTEDIYEAEYLLDLKTKLSLTNPSIDFKLLAKINISYCIVFFGVSAEGALNLRNLFAGKYKEEFIEEIILFIQMKPVQESIHWLSWEKLDKISDFKRRIRIARLIRMKRNTTPIGDEFEEHDISKATEFFYRNDFVKYYGGHQFRLGHYFRHLFQSFKYVNTQDQLSKKEKYFYAKTFRAQLSTYEQSILFLNSLSFLGMAWDLCPEYKKYKIDLFEKSRCQNSRLITRYNLVKNLPGENIFGIRYKAFYPEVKYEF